jgi:hypothetical protein
MSINVVLAKDLGSKVARTILHDKLVNLYAGNASGVSHDQDAGTTTVHIDDGEDDAAAIQLLADVAAPTCVPTGLTIRTNYGTLLVDDDTVVAAHATLEKFFLVEIVIDEASGDLETYVFEKTSESEYEALPAGKKGDGCLKEYSLPALGAVLTEIETFI